MSPTCMILVPQLGIEPVLPAVEALSLNHWMTREVPQCMNFKGTKFRPKHDSLSLTE